jgi:hypothetical protein
MRKSSYIVISFIIAAYTSFFMYGIWEDYQNYTAGFHAKVTAVSYHNRGGYEYFYNGGSFFGGSFSDPRVQFLKVGDSVQKQANGFILRVIPKNKSSKTIIYQSEGSHFFTKWLAGS